MTFDNLESKTNFVESVLNVETALQVPTTERNELQSTMKKFTGDVDAITLPLTKKLLGWDKFNIDLWSTQRKITEVKDICERFGHKLIDLRPYLNEEPYIVHTTDKLPKVLDLFRHFHLRALPVLDPNDGLPVAVLTRQDVFAYCAL